MWNPFRKPNLAALSRLDTQAIKVSDVAELLGCSERTARWVCETAVRRGEFSKWEMDGTYALRETSHD